MRAGSLICRSTEAGRTHPGRPGRPVGQSSDRWSPVGRPGAAARTSPPCNAWFGRPGSNCGCSLHPTDDHDLALIRRGIEALPHQRLSDMVDAVRSWTECERPPVPEFDPVAALRVLADTTSSSWWWGESQPVSVGRHSSPRTSTSPRPRDHRNLDRLAAALEELDARLRTATEPEGVPFPFDPALLESATVWTLTTKHGDLDLVMAPAGTGGYQDLIRDADELTVAVDPDLKVKVASSPM